MGNSGLPASAPYTSTGCLVLFLRAPLLIGSWRKGEGGDDDYAEGAESG